VIVRLLLFLTLVAVGVAGLLYLFTRNRRYLKFARQLLMFTFIFLVIFAILFVLERLILI
jgi:hypothetical protein